MTKDGAFTVAKEIELEDKFENMGAQMVREVASKSSDFAGDGTTTATVLAQAIVKEGSKAVAAGMNPMDRCVAGPAIARGRAHHIVHAEIGDINQHQAGENFAGAPPHASSISEINTNRARQAHAVLSSAVDGLP